MYGYAQCRGYLSEAIDKEPDDQIYGRDAGISWKSARS